MLRSIAYGLDTVYPMKLMMKVLSHAKAFTEKEIKD